MVLSAHNIGVVAVSTALFTCFYRFVCPPLSKKLTRRFHKLNKRDQTEWNERIMSSFHALIASLVSTTILVTDQYLQDNPVWGFSYWGKSILGFTLSYMAVDMGIIFSYFKFDDLVFVFHHIAAIFAYYIAIEFEFLIWFGCVRLTAEWSTIFVNARWHMYMVGAKESKYYMLNALLMSLTFFLCRIVPMPYYWYQVYHYYEHIPPLGMFTILVSCILLDALNLFWMYKLTVGIFKTFGQTQFVYRIRNILSRVVDDLNRFLVL